jgi:diguanylate cyclase (GGDEF)-like protein
MKQAEIELQRAKRYETPLSFVMLDIDCFKYINDTYGHGLGDAVICAISAMLQKRLRSSDLVARLGGDEFIVMLPATSLTDTLEVAEALRRGVADLRFGEGDATIRATASIGVASLRDGDDTLVDILKNVDRQLYRAKNGGRNRVELAPSFPAARAMMENG